MPPESKDDRITLFSVYKCGYMRVFVPETNSHFQVSQRASVIDMPGAFVNWRSVHYVNRNSFIFAAKASAMTHGYAPGADAVHSGGVALDGNESTAFYKLSQVIFAVFF